MVPSGAKATCGLVLLLACAACDRHARSGGAASGSSAVPAAKTSSARATSPAGASTAAEPGYDGAIGRIAEGAMTQTEVTATVHLLVGPGEPEKGKCVRVASVG